MLNEVKHPHRIWIPRFARNDNTSAQNIYALQYHDKRPEQCSKTYTFICQHDLVDEFVDLIFKDAFRTRALEFRNKRANNFLFNNNFYGNPFFR